MLPIDKVRNIVTKYESLEKELSSGKIAPKLFAQKSKEYSKIGEVINEAKGYIKFQKEKEELSKIVNEKDGDKEMAKLASKELDDLLKKFVVSLLKKAAAKTGNKVDDLLVAQLEKSLFDS